jgi:hypothetical protein
LSLSGRRKKERRRGAEREREREREEEEEEEEGRAVRGGHGERPVPAVLHTSTMHL